LVPAANKTVEKVSTPSPGGRRDVMGRSDGIGRIPLSGKGLVLCHTCNFG
jgi:hypothetical protein